MHADSLFSAVELQKNEEVAGFSVSSASSLLPIAIAAPIFAIPVAKRARLTRFESDDNNINGEDDTTTYYDVMLADVDNSADAENRRPPAKCRRKHRKRRSKNATGIDVDEEEDEAALFGEDENGEEERDDASSSDDEDFDVCNKMREVSTAVDTSNSTNACIRDTLARHQTEPPPVVSPVRLFKISTETWVTGKELSMMSLSTSNGGTTDIGNFNDESASYLPVLDPFHGEHGSFSKFKALILDYNGTINVDTFATWKSTLMAADAMVKYYRERICEIYDLKKRWLKEASSNTSSKETNSGGGGRGCTCDSDIFALTLNDIKDATRSSMPDIMMLRERMMMYDNPFSSFTCWRSCNPGSFEEYAEKAGLINLIGYEEWNKNGRKIMLDQSKMYRDFWVPRTAIPAPGLVSFIRHVEKIKMPWFIVSLHPIDKIKKEFDWLLQRVDARDMLPTFIEHVTPLQLVSPVRSRYECEINNHTFKEKQPHVYCRQDKIATIEKILDDLLGTKGIEESDVLNVGDSILDLQVSLTLGMRFCGVHWGYCLRSTFKMNNAYVLPEYHDMSFLTAYADDGRKELSLSESSPISSSSSSSSTSSFFDPLPPRPPTPPSAPPLNTMLE